MDYVGLRQQCLSFLKAPTGRNLFIKLFKVHSVWVVHSGSACRVELHFHRATIPTKCCHLSAGVRPGFHLSVAREVERVVGERDREPERERRRKRRGRRRFATPLVTLWFVAQRSQAASHSCITFFPLLQLSANSELAWTSPDTTYLQSSIKSQSSN